MEVLFEVGGFDIDRGVEMTLIQVYIDVQKCDFGGGVVPSELEGLAAVRLSRNWVRELGP